jgi:hypothetical protein
MKILTVEWDAGKLVRTTIFVTNISESTGVTCQPIVPQRTRVRSLHPPHCQEGEDRLQRTVTPVLSRLPFAARSHRSWSSTATT